MPISSGGSSSGWVARRADMSLRMLEICFLRTAVGDSTAEDGIIPSSQFLRRAELSEGISGDSEAHGSAARRMFGLRDRCRSGHSPLSRRSCRATGWPPATARWCDPSRLIRLSALHAAMTSAPRRTGARNAGRRLPALPRRKANAKTPRTPREEEKKSGRPSIDTAAHRSEHNSPFVGVNRWPIVGWSSLPLLALLAPWRSFFGAKPDARQGTPPAPPAPCLPLLLQREHRRVEAAAEGAHLLRVGAGAALDEDLAADR